MKDTYKNLYDLMGTLVVILISLVAYSSFMSMDNLFGYARFWEVLGAMFIVMYILKELK